MSIMSCTNVDVEAKFYNNYKAVDVQVPGQKLKLRKKYKYRFKLFR